MVIFPLAPDQTIAQMWSNGARGADHLNYGKYLPCYCLQLCNLQDTHPGAEVLLSAFGFSVACSTTPGCWLPIDQTIEQTINRSAKSSGRVIGFSRNVGAYHRWCLTRHERAMFAEATLDHLDRMEETTNAHNSTHTSSVKRSENGSPVSDEHN